MKNTIIHSMQTRVSGNFFETLKKSKYLQRTQRNQIRRFRLKVVHIRHGLSSFSSLTYRDDGILQQIRRHGLSLEIYLLQPCPSFHATKSHNLKRAAQ